MSLLDRLKSPPRASLDTLDATERRRVYVIAQFVFLTHQLAHLWMKRSSFMFATIAIAVALIALYPRLRERLATSRPRLLATSAAVYYLFVTLNLIPFFILVGMSNPWSLPVTAVIVAAFVTAHRAGYGVGAFVGFLMLGVALLVYAEPHLVDGFGALVVLVAALWGAGAYAVSRPRALAFFPTTPLAYFVATMTLLPLGLVHYSGVNPDLLEKIETQPGVRAVYGYTDNAPLQGRFGTRIMFAAPMGSGLLFSPHDGAETVYLVTDDPITSERNIESLDVQTRGGDRIVIPPGEPNHAYLGGRGQILKLAAEPLRLVQRIPIDGRLVNNLRLNAERGWIFGSPEGSRSVVRLDIETGAVAYSEAADPRLWIEDVVLDNIGGDFYALALAAGRVVIIHGNQKSLTLRRTRVLDGGLGIFLEIDPVDRRLYLPATFTGELRILDSETLEERDRVPLEVGIRDLTFDAKRRVLYVAGYFRGGLYALDVDSGRILGKLDLGPALKPPQLSDDGRFLYIRSSAGVFQVDTAVAFPDTGDVAIQGPALPRPARLALDFAFRRTFFALPGLPMIDIIRGMSAESNAPSSDAATATKGAS
ncbi:MAG: hypothetical protein H6684_04660 [Deltaproteobacteria bacterium]|nr:hypothetical protein [Deltaproteobacteria bacterium]